MMTTTETRWTVLRERPFVLSEHEVRGLVARRITQLRRLVAFNEINAEPDEWKLTGMTGDRNAALFQRIDDLAPRYVRCPYGQPDDRLWGRETHHITPSLVPVYRADYPENAKARGLLNIPPESDVRWLPPVGMPRWASRITLEVEKVRVERLQEVTPEDAIAAGGFKKLSKDNGHTWKYGIPDRDGWPGTDDEGWPWDRWRISPIDAYEWLWDRTMRRKDCKWKFNRWVWVLDVKVIPS